MSKTTTWANANARNVRGTSNSTEGAAHHVITVGKGETKRHQREGAKQKEGYVLGEGIKERSERRISIRNNANGPSSAERGRPKGKSDKVDHGVVDRTENRNPLVSDQKTPHGQSKTKPKVPIQEFYAQNNMNYRLIRKNCRIKVNAESGGSKVDPSVCVDFYQPPEGYTMDDLPDSQGASSQKEEEPLSPAVMIAAYHKKDRSKVLNLTPETASDEIIRRIQMGRRCKKVSDNSPESPPNVNDVTHDTVQRLNDTFPDNSLNDSDLIMASQQVEDEFVSGHDKLITKDGLKRDINGKSKKQTPIVAPFASTPLPELIKNAANVVVDETPKTARGVARSRNRSNTNNHTNNSLFENSIVNEMELGESKSSEEGDGETPRKLLKFDESPIKKVILESVVDLKDNSGEHVRSGEFDDDNEDELFSQMEIPGEMREPRPAVLGSSAESADKSLPVTQLVDDDSTGQADSKRADLDSYLDEDQLNAIAKLEAIHCRSTGSAEKTVGSNTPKYNVKNLGVSDKSVPTPRTRARRQGLSRNTRRVIAH